jgi:hypothetical protein
VPAGIVIEGRIDYVRNQLDRQEFTIAARESAMLIEFALRELYHRSLNEIEGRKRAAILKLELEIGQQRGRNLRRLHLR